MFFCCIYNAFFLILQHGIKKSQTIKLNNIMEFTNNKYLFFPFFFLIATLCASCQESLEDRAARDAEEYTRKYCPTPVINYTRTDSVTFNKEKHVFTYFCTFTDLMDSQEIIDKNYAKITQMLRASIKESTSMKPYVQAGFHFQYICRSEKFPQKTLLQVKY